MIREDDAGPRSYVQKLVAFDLAFRVADVIRFMYNQIVKDGRDTGGTAGPCPEG